MAQSSLLAKCPSRILRWWYRCGMNQTSMYEMRHSIVKAVSDFVEIEGEEMVEVNISNEPDLGTVYSVAVPVRCGGPPMSITPGLSSESYPYSQEALIAWSFQVQIIIETCAKAKEKALPLDPNYHTLHP
jgi:hypothetical protein